MAESRRQVAIAIDLNKCMGCQTCTVACKMFRTNDKGMDHMWWMKVNTMPGRGYPKDWERMGGGYQGNGKEAQPVLGKLPTIEDYGGVMEFNYEEVFYGGGGQQAHLVPKEKPTWGPNWAEDIGVGEYPNAYYFYLPRLCNHCFRPTCADVCPHGAIHKRDEDGVVLVEEDKCRGCDNPVCMRACPYKEVWFNTERRVAQNCDACLQRIRAEVAPACVRQCPGRCIWIDFLDNEEGAVHKLVREWKVALPLHPEFNTGPNVYYIPPMAPPTLDEEGNVEEGKPRISLEYLRSLFGPRVEQALQTLREEMAKRRRDPRESSELMDLLIARRWQELLGPFPKDPSEVEVDTETGEIRLVDYLATQDSGTVINPQVLKNQVVGGAICGAGFTLCEGLAFDEQTGRVINADLLDYKVLRAVDFPSETRVLFGQSHDPVGPFGARSAGEAPAAAPVPAIAQAVYNAIRARVEPPMTPERVLRALDET